MKLCLDCGNTRIKWGLHDGKNWLAHGAVATTAADQLTTELALLPAADTITACNVAGESAEAAVNAQFPGRIYWNRAQAEQAGVSNGYEIADALGADRWAALLGARALHPGSCLVVNAGTATTIDLLTADGRFVGGLILPGLDLMRSALARNTAQLPAVAGTHKAIPNNTLDAITSGATHATLGALERMFRQLEALGGGEPLCLLAGGAAPLLTPHLTLPFRTEPLLILHGLVQLAP